MSKQSPKRFVVLVWALLLACLTAIPAGADSEPPPGYNLTIKAFLAPVSATTYAVHGASQLPPVARIHQSAGAPGSQIAATVRICATGSVHLGRIRLLGVPSNSDFRIRYSRMSDGADITASVVAGTYRTWRFQLGKCFHYRMDVVRTRSASSGDLRTVSLSTNPEGPGLATLKAATHVTAK